MATVPPPSAMPQQVVYVQQQGYAGQPIPGQQQQIILQTVQAKVLNHWIIWSWCRKKT